MLLERPQLIMKSTEVMIYALFRIGSQSSSFGLPRVAGIGRRGALHAIVIRAGFAPAARYAFSSNTDSRSWDALERTHSRYPLFHS